MPELPEVETVRNCLSRVMTGRTIVSVLVRRPDLRRPFPKLMAERLTGQQVLQIRRFGKYILVDLSSSETLIIHLGMSGAFTISPDSTYYENSKRYAAHDHVIFYLEGNTAAIYSDPRRFGSMDMISTAMAESHPLIKILGPEPLGKRFNEQHLWTELRSRRVPIKAALLNQRVVAGLGNIYVCEALWQSGISPRRRCDRIALKRIELLICCIRRVLQDAIAVGGSTLRDYHPPDGEIGYFQHHFSVYGREGQDCPRIGCTGKVSRIKQSGRSTFYCATCQK